MGNGNKLQCENSLGYSWKYFGIVILIYYFYYYYYHFYEVLPSPWAPYTQKNIFMEHEWLRCQLNLLCLTVSMTLSLLQCHILNCDSNHLDEEQSSSCHCIQLHWWVSAHMCLQTQDSNLGSHIKSGNAHIYGVELGPHHCGGNGLSATAPS